MKSDSSCTSFETCDAVGSYFYNETDMNFYFELVYTKKWAAFAQNTFVENNNRMVRN